MATTWCIEIDSSDDLTYAMDVSANVMFVEWFVGMAAYESVSSNWLLAKLDNVAKGYNSLPPGRRIRVKSDDGTSRTHFVGHIDDVEVGAADDKTVVVHAFGAEEHLKYDEIILPAMQDVRADEIITTVLNASSVLRDDYDTCCYIDFTGHNTIDTHRITDLDDNIVRDLDTALSEFVYVGDRWRDGASVLSIIEDAVDSERGRFFIARDGKATFLHRHHAIMGNAIVHTFTDAGIRLDCRYGNSVKTCVEIDFIPRTTGAANSILWELGQAQKILMGEDRTIIVSFTDDAIEQAGALVVDDPVVWSATSERDGSGSDLTDYLGVFVLTSAFSGMEIVLENNTTVDIYLQTLVVRGTPLLGTNPMLLAYKATTRFQYGDKRLKLNLPFVTDLDMAKSAADYELQRRKSPRRDVIQLTTDDSLHPSEILSLKVFDRIKVVESQSGVDDSYMIVGEKHMLYPGSHEVSWSLEGSDFSIYIVIDTHSIDGTNLIAPF